MPARTPFKYSHLDDSTDPYRQTSFSKRHNQIPIHELKPQKTKKLKRRHKKKKSKKSPAHPISEHLLEFLEPCLDYSVYSSPQPSSFSAPPLPSLRSIRLPGNLCISDTIRAEINVNQMDLWADTKLSGYNRLQPKSKGTIGEKILSCTLSEAGFRVGKLTNCQSDDALNEPGTYLCEFCMEQRKYSIPYKDHIICRKCYNYKTDDPHNPDRMVNGVKTEFKTASAQKKKGCLKAWDWTVMHIGLYKVWERLIIMGMNPPTEGSTDIKTHIKWISKVDFQHILNTQPIETPDGSFSFKKQTGGKKADNDDWMISGKNLMCLWNYHMHEMNTW